MAFGEELVARLGLDNRPFSRGLRSSRMLAQDFSRETNSHFKSILKGGATLFGLEGLRRGFRALLDMAREAREEGQEFSKQGWISAENLSVLKAMEDAFSGIVRNVKEFAAFSIGGIGRFFRQLGAFTVTGNWEEARKEVEKMAEADKEALESTRKKREEEEKLKRFQKDKIELDRKAKELARIDADRLKRQEAITLQLQKQSEEISKQQRSLATSREERAKLTLEELAFSPLRFRGRLGQEQQTARQVVGLEQQAEALRLAGFQDAAFQRLNLAEDLRRGLTNVVESDRFIFANMEDAIRKSEDHLAELARAAIKDGVRIIPANGK